MARKLSDREEHFCREYVIDKNATRAAIAAGYSEHTAQEQSSRLLSKAIIRSRVDTLLSARLKKADVTAEKVIQRLANLAFFDSTRLYREDGTLKHPSELDPETADAVAGFEVHELMQDGDGKGVIGQVKKYKLLDRGQNLERLGRTFALFKDKLQVDGLEGLAEAIAEARKRASNGG